MTDEKSQNKPPQLLRCGSCGRVIECSYDETTIYLIGGWPKCCGKTMSLFVEVQLPKGAKN